MTNVSFVNNKDYNWATGEVNVTGYKDGVIRFGTDSTGLTAGQLNQIEVDGGGGAVLLDASGYLVSASTISIDDTDTKVVTRISVPSIVSDKLLLRTPQNSVKIMGINGVTVYVKNTKNQEEVDVTSLPSGVYFILFNDKTTEKFVKK